MKFLLNMNVPPSLSKKFITQGHSCRHVGEIGMASASDPRHLWERIFDSLPKMERALTKGAVVSLEDAALRIRELPIARWEVE